MYGRDALEGVNVVTLRNPADHHAGTPHAAALLLETERALCRGVGRISIL